LALSANSANRLHLKIQHCILELNRKSVPVASAFDDHLAPLFRMLAVVEATGWRAVSTHTIDAELSADFVAMELEWEHAEVAAVTKEAANVSTALSHLTSLQRDILLAKPLVALANNIAMDCQTEFDDGDALSRWQAALKNIRSGEDVASLR